MVTSPYEWKILEWDEIHKQINKTFAQYTVTSSAQHCHIQSDNIKIYD